MACTLKALQDTEYEILCAFADHCEKHGIEYYLDWGTLLGAIRHNGFIPWDDDVDVTMEIRELRRFVRTMRGQPIPGMHLSWFQWDMQYPFTFPKLQKDGTCMPENYQNGLDVHKGVWMDIFFYCGVPKSAFLRKLQWYLLLLYRWSGRQYVLNNVGEQNASLTRLIRVFAKMPHGLVKLVRALLFDLLCLLSTDKSDQVVFVGVNQIREDYNYYKREYVDRKTTHIFNSREFSVPENYDALLTHHYGDYMVPVQSDAHVNTENICL